MGLTTIQTIIITLYSLKKEGNFYAGKGVLVLSLLQLGLLLFGFSTSILYAIVGIALYSYYLMYDVRSIVSGKHGNFII